MPVTINVAAVRDNADTEYEESRRVQRSLLSDPRLFKSQMYGQAEDTETTHKQTMATYTTAVIRT